MQDKKNKDVKNVRKEPCRPRIELKTRSQQSTDDNRLTRVLTFGEQKPRDRKRDVIFGNAGGNMCDQAKGTHRTVFARKRSGCGGRECAAQSAHEQQRKAAPASESARQDREP